LGNKSEALSLELQPCTYHDELSIQHKGDRINVLLRSLLSYQLGKLPNLTIDVSTGDCSLFKN